MAAGAIYRKLSYGPLLDVFVLDMRSYRGGNDDNLGGEKPFLGREQLDWLKRELKASDGAMESDRRRHAHWPGCARR